MRFDKPDTTPDRPSVWEVMAAIEGWAITSVLLALIIACCLAASGARAAAVPPEPRLARSLTPAQIARAVTNAPAGAAVQVPAAACRVWQAKHVYAAGEACLWGGTAYVCIRSHTSGKHAAPAAQPELWQPAGSVRTEGGRGKRLPANKGKTTWKRF